MTGRELIDIIKAMTDEERGEVLSLLMQAPIEHVNFGYGKGRFFGVLPDINCSILESRKPTEPACHVATTAEIVG